MNFITRKKCKPLGKKFNDGDAVISFIFLTYRKRLSKHENHNTDFYCGCTECVDINQCSA